MATVLLKRLMGVVVTLDELEQSLCDESEEHVEKRPV